MFLDSLIPTHYTCVFLSGVCIFVRAEHVWVDITEVARNHQDEA